MVDPLITLFEVFVFLVNFPSHGQNTLKSSLFESEVAPFKSAQSLKPIWILETRGHELFKHEIKF